METQFVVIGTGEWQRSIYELLEKEYGPEKLWGVGPNLPTWFKYKYFNCDVKNTLEIEDYFKAKGCNFIFLTSQTDVAVPTVSRLNKTFGTNFVSPKIAKNYTDKYQMRLLAKNSGFESIFFKKVGIEDIEDEILSFSNEVVTKPLQLQSSIGVKLWNSQVDQKEVKKYVDFLLNRNIKNVIFEEFLEGDEYTVEGYKFIGGNHKILAVSKKTKKCGFGIANDLIYSNSHLDAETYSKLFNILDNYFCDYIFGPTHTEIIIKDGKIYLVEAAIRSGGSNIPSVIVPNMCGFNQELQLINDVIGQDYIQEVKEKGKVTVLSFFRIKTEVFPELSFDGNFVLSHWQAGGFGTKALPVVDDRSRHGYIIFSLPSKSNITLDELKERIINQNNGLMDFYD